MLISVYIYYIVLAVPRYNMLKYSNIVLSCNSNKLVVMSLLIMFNSCILLHICLDSKHLHKDCNEMSFVLLPTPFPGIPLSGYLFSLSVKACIVFLLFRLHFSFNRLCTCVTLEEKNSIEFKQ